jgi:hypothetical protein
MTIGTKLIRGLQVGIKTAGRHYLGNKSNPLTKAIGGALIHSATGIINNYSNSADVAKEPMKGVQIGKPKQRFQQIEKPRPRTNSKDENFN